MAGYRFTLHETEVEVRPDRMMWVPSSRALVASDMHFEKGSAFAAKGQMLPPYDTAETLNRLERAIKALKPDVVIALGDSFHDVRADGRLYGADRDRLFDLSRALPFIWIEGNHDPEVPSWLEGARTDQFVLSGLTFRHEPTGQVAGEVAGHLHPCAKVAGRAGRVRRACFASDGRTLVMPSLGAFTGGLNVLDVAFAGLFLAPMRALVPGRGTIHAIAKHRLAPDQSQR